MKTVSRDDELVERAANPRTGIVSPFVTSEDSNRENTSDDYVTVERPREKKARPDRNISNGRWEQDSQGWSMVRSPSPSPVSRSAKDTTSRLISMEVLRNDSPPDLPGVCNMKLTKTTGEQPRRHQKCVEQSNNYGDGTHSASNPAIFARRITPERPTSQPRKLQKTIRKEVGNVMASKLESSDTVIANGHATATPLSHPKYHARGSQQLRMASPSQTVQGGLSRISQDAIASNPCLTSQEPITGSDAQPDLKRRGLYANVQQPSGIRRSPEEGSSDHPLSSSILSQYLPRPHSPHSNHFAGLAATSYRRPAQLLPARLQPLEDRWRAVEDACIFPATTGPNSSQGNHQRPKLRRQNERDGLQSIDRQAFHGRSQETHLHQSMVPLNVEKRSCKNAIDLADRSVNLTRIKTRLSSEAGLWRDLVDMGGSEAGTRATKPNRIRMEGLMGDISPQRDRLSPRSAKMVTEPVARSRDIRECIHVCGHQNRNAQNSEARHIPLRDGFKRQQPSKEVVGYTDEGGVCFEGQWANKIEIEKEADDPLPKQQVSIARRHRLSKKAAGARSCIQDIESLLQTSMLVARLQQIAKESICQVVSTLRRASPAIDVIRAPTADSTSYLRAVIDLMLAGLYLSVLLNALMVVGRLLLVVVRLVYWICHPIQLVSAIMRWYILG